ncbi:MAG: DUF308 domain-containing protein [Bacilli bacterium]|nr:DUF308 domain-containing protein [Bacilli bacterium]
MNDIKKAFNLITIGTIILDIIFIIFGIFLISNPTVGLESALLLIGLFLTISGIYSIVKYIINNKVFLRFELPYGILSIIVGLFAIFKPFDVATLITVLTGIWLIITSIIKFTIAVEFRKIKEDTWVFDLTVSVLTILLGIMLIINPFNGYMIISSYAGVLIMIYSAMDIIEQFFIRQRANHIIKFLKK